MNYKFADKYPFVEDLQKHPIWDNHDFTPDDIRSIADLILI